MDYLEVGLKSGTKMIVRDEASVETFVRRLRTFKYVIVDVENEGFIIRTGIRANSVEYVCGEIKELENE